MATTLRVIVVQSDSELARLLDEQGDKPFILRRGDESWRVIPDDDEESEDLWADYDPEAVLRALDETGGLWKDRDTQAMIDEIYAARERGSRPPDGR